MRMKLGGELELTNVDVRNSTVEARQTFLTLILKMKPEVVDDLLGLYNSKAVPENLKNNSISLELLARTLLMHTKRSDLFLADLTDIGFPPNIRQTPVMAYFEFIFRNQNEFSLLLEKSKAECEKEFSNPSPGHIKISALREFIPDWKSLQLKEGSEWLCHELRNWANTWNLADDWCLDFALDCLRNLKVDHIDKITLPEDFLKAEKITPLWSENHEFHNGSIWRMTISELEDRYQNYYFTLKIPNYPLFNYKWTEIENRRTTDVFTVHGFYNPLKMLADEFRQETQEKFWFKFFEHFSNQYKSLAGKNKVLTEQLYKFEKSINDYISKCEKLMKPFTEKTPSKKDKERHLQWLIEFQILKKDYIKIAEEDNSHRSSVTDAIRGVASLIGLTLMIAPRGRKQKQSKNAS